MKMKVNINKKSIILVDIALCNKKWKMQQSELLITVYKASHNKNLTLK